jgi:TrmH family RNA methyltransferase
MIKKINSPENPLVKHVVQLHSSKYREKHQEFIAEGFRTISTLIASQSKLITLFTIDDFLYDTQQIAPDSSIIVVTPSLMDKISTAKSPSGFLAVFAMPEAPSLDTLNAGIVLAQISDPGNMGTLIRTAAAMNKKTVVCVETVDPWNPKVVQATAGALGNVSIFRLSWNDLLANKKNINLCALVAADGNTPEKVNLKNALIVIGNEGAGIPDAWINQCDEKLTLPMPGKFESLNAAVAGSIALYLSAME